MRFKTLLACLFFISGNVFAEDNLDGLFRRLEADWADIYYQMPEENQADAFNALLQRIRAAKVSYPQRAEPLILEAITLCTLAGVEWGLSSLSRVEDARALLLKSIQINPKAMEATAYITLGNLYYRLPGWPISYGDDDEALRYLELATGLYPSALDANYFLGDYWLTEGEYDKALTYLEKADKAPIRSYLLVSDKKIKAEVKQALQAAIQHDDTRDDFFTRSAPSLEAKAD